MSIMTNHEKHPRSCISILHVPISRHTFTTVHRHPTRSSHVQQRRFLGPEASFPNISGPIAMHDIPDPSVNTAPSCLRLDFTTPATPIYSPHPPILHGVIDHNHIQRLWHLNHRPSSFAPLYSPSFFEYSPLCFRRWKPCGVATAYQRCRCWMVFYHRRAGNRRHSGCTCYRRKSLRRALEETKTELTTRRRIRIRWSIA